MGCSYTVTVSHKYNTVLYYTCTAFIVVVVVVVVIVVVILQVSSVGVDGTRDTAVSYNVPNRE